METKTLYCSRCQAPRELVIPEAADPTSYFCTRNHGMYMLTYDGVDELAASDVVVRPLQYLSITWKAFEFCTRIELDFLEMFQTFARGDFGLHGKYADISKRARGRSQVAVSNLAAIKRRSGEVVGEYAVGRTLRIIHTLGEEEAYTIILLPGEE